MVSEPIYGHLMGVIGTGLLSLASSLRTADFSPEELEMSLSGDERGETSVVRRLSGEGTVYSSTHKTATNPRMDHTGET